MARDARGGGGGSAGEGGDAPTGPALREAVRGVEFPVTKEALVRQAGEASIPAGEGVTVRLGDALAKAPGEVFDSVEDLEDQVTTAVRRGDRGD